MHLVKFLPVYIITLMALTLLTLLLVSVGFVSDATVGLLLLFLFYALFRNFDLKLISLLKFHILQLPKLTQQLLGSIRDWSRRSLLFIFWVK